MREITKTVRDGVFGILLFAWILNIIFSPLTIGHAGSSDPIHPFLFFDANEIPTLQHQAVTTHSDLWSFILTYVNTLPDSLPAPTAPNTDDQEVYVNAGLQVIPPAFVCAVTRRAEYCDLSKQILMTYANWRQWGPSETRGRGLAYMVLGNAIAYDWIYNTLSPLEQETIRDSLIGWSHAIYIASKESYRAEWGNWWGKSYMQNHYWILHSALGVAGLALDGEEFLLDCSIDVNYTINQRAGPGIEFAVVGSLGPGRHVYVSTQAEDPNQQVWLRLLNGTWVNSNVVNLSEGCQQPLSGPQVWVDYSRDKMSIGRDILESMGDGSWHESMHYQSMLLSASLPFLVNLRKIQKVDLLPYRYLHNYSYWRIFNHIPETEQFLLSFGDFEWWWGNTFKPQHILRFIARETGDGHAEWMAQQLKRIDISEANVYSAPWSVFEFLYFDPTIVPVPPDDLSGARVFSDLEGVIWRTGWEPDDIIFGLKTGPYGGRFAFDTFTQDLYPWDQPCRDNACSLLTDHDHDDVNGFYIYGLGQWLAPETVGYGLFETSFHNTLLIDQAGQFRPPSGSYGEFVEYYLGYDGFLAATANSPHFNFVVADATRRYDVDGLIEYTRHVVFVRPDYLIMLDNLVSDTPHQYEWVCHFGEDVAIEGDWIRSDAENEQILGVAVVSPVPFIATTGNDGNPFVHTQPASPSGNVRLIHFLFPTKESAWISRPEIQLLEETDEVAGIRVEMQDGSGRKDDILLNYGREGDAKQIGSYLFDGDVAVIVRGVDNEIEKIFVSGGTFLADQMVNEFFLVNNLNSNYPFEAVYDENSVAISSDLLDHITLFAPNVNSLTINGVNRPFVRDGDHISFVGQE